MTEFSFEMLNNIHPEIFLAVSAMVLLVGGLFAGARAVRIVSIASIVCYIAAAVLVLCVPVERTEVLGGMLVTDSFSALIKLFILGGLAAATLMSIRYLESERIDRFEYPVLVMLSGLGMMLMVSAHNLISLYVALELQSLSLYVLAAIRRDHVRSAESGMKYFVLGAISSGMLLFGMSLLYGYTGTADFGLIGGALAIEVTLGALIGMVFVIAGLAFKVSAVPFHMWTPDVYEGAPTSVTALFAIVPKLAALALIIRLLSEPFASLQNDWGQMIWVLSLASMTVGAFAGLRQGNIKRLLAYSSIGNMGYALIGLAAGTATGVSALILYMGIYMVMTAGTFAIILSLRRNGQGLETISDFAGLSRAAPVRSYALALLMFSISGIPPMAGFFGKLMIFQAAVEADLMVLAVLGVLTSVVAAYYYLKIIKTMFFDEPAGVFDAVVSKGCMTVMAVSLAFILAFIFAPSFLADISETAALSLSTGVQS